MVSQQNVNKALAECLQSNPQFQQYNTSKNSDALWSYLIGAYGENSPNLESPTAWEIAFKHLIQQGKLKAIPNWVAPLTQEERERVRNASAAETKELLRKDPEFKRAFDLVAAEEFAEREACRLDPWRWMTREQYNSMEPISKARLYAENENFRNSVQRLINEGKI